MWMPQQQENKQQHPQSANMVPVSSDISGGLNSSNYVQQEWQSQQFQPTYGQYGQQQPTRQAPQMQTQFQLNAYKSPTQPQQQQQSNWQTQPLQVPTPLPPQYANFTKTMPQQQQQQQLSNNLYKNQQQHQPTTQQNQQPPQQNQLQQQLTTAPQTSTYFQQQPLQVPMFSPTPTETLTQTEQQMVVTTTDSLNNFPHNNFGQQTNITTSVEQQQLQHHQQQQQSIANNNAPKLENFFDHNKRKDSEGVDGWDDWEWNDLNIQKEITENAPAPSFNSNLMQSYNHQQQQTQPQHQQQQQQNDQQQNQYQQLPQDQKPHQNQVQEQLHQPPQPQQYSSHNVNQSEDKNQQQIQTSQNSQNLQPLRNSTNDNWQWGSTDDSRENYIKSFENVENKNLEAFIIEDSFKTNNNNNFFPTIPIQQPQIEENKGQEKQPKQKGTNNLENNQNLQNSHGNNPVYISQAKPVSQPPKQFASPPGRNSPPTSVNQIQHPDISKIPPPQLSPEEGNTQQENILETKTELPPPPIVHQIHTNSNPFKRTGPAQHGRAGAFLPPPVKSSSVQPNFSTQFFSPPPPEEFQNSRPQSTSYSSSLSNQENQEIVSPENSEIVNDINENIEDTNDRNRYMQISHLSEEGSEFGSNNQPSQQSGRHYDIEEHTNENDSFPPPGLSRLVLGQPETENTLPLPPMPSSVQNISSNYIPPNFDRMVPGTELASSSTLNLERQADGQDTIPSPISAFTNAQTVSADIDDEINSDRNLYQVPGKSEHNDNQQTQIFVQTLPVSNNIPSSSMPQHQNERVVTGVEDNHLTNQTNSNQREIEMEGENLEDEQQLHQKQLGSNKNFNSHQTELNLPSSRDEPIEGANIQDYIPQNMSNKSNDIEISLGGTSEKMTLSLPSTANDESDERGDRPNAIRKNSRHLDDKRSKRSSENEVGRIDYDPIEDKKNNRYYSEESDDNSSDNRNKNRSYREGSVKNQRDKYKSGVEEHKDKQSGRTSGRYREGGKDYRNVKNERSEDERNETERNRRRSNNEKQRERYEKGGRDYKDRKSDRSDRDRDRERERGHRHKRYDNDSRYETEGSRYYRGDSDQDFGAGYRRDEKDRKYKKQQRDEKDERRSGTSGGVEYNTIERDRKRDRRRGERDDRGEYKYEDRKDKHRRSKKDKGSRSDYDDEYRKGSSSRNASERERELLRSSGREKELYSQMYGYSNVYGYDPYAYYQQQQQYYEQLRRTNPQAYAEWYNKYFTENGNQLHPDMMATGPASTMTNTTGADGRESVHSGRSSVNNDKDRVDNMSLTIGDSASLTQELHRLTPQKFNNEHAIVSLSAGVMVWVKPKYMQKSGSKIVKIVKIGCNDSTRRLFQAFPGPLVRGITHKKTIIEFCEDQIRLGPTALQKIHSRQNSMSSINSVSQSNKASFVLMWNLLILLLRQNGVVIGTDIAELLIRNEKEYPYENNVNSTKRSLYKENSNDYNKDDSLDDENKNESLNKSDENSDTENDVKTDDDDHDDLADDLVRKVKNLKIGSSTTRTRSKHNLTESEITDKFRNYLLYGNINEALEWASNNNLWGHALFLASKVDRRLYANVMMKFANKLPFNDPLQTLYQLMSYKTPASVTCVQDDKWGDWRPHLAMILSNTSQRPDLDRKAITTLGDSLYNRGDYFAAHFCFLMAQVGFGTYSNAAKQHENSFMLNSQNAVRLVLLGSPFNKKFREFAFNEAIMMTEIYEYACSLNDEKFSIPEFQPYKYLLATRMLDYGFQMKALMYMEQISLHIQLDPSKYEMSFIAKICDLSDRLKFYDPTIEKTLDNLDPNDPKFTEVIDQFENQKWLQDLQNVLGNYKPEIVAYNRQNSNEGNSSYGNYESNVQNQNQQQYEQQNENIVDQFRAINQQFYELNSQYNTNNYSLDSLNQQQQQQPQIQQPHVPQEQVQNLNTVNQNSTFGAEYQPQHSQSAQFYDPSKMQQQQIQENANENDNTQNVQQLQYQQQQQQQPQMNQYGLQENQLAGQQNQNFINNQNGYEYNSWNQSSIDQRGMSEEPMDYKSKSITPEIDIIKKTIPIKSSSTTTIATNSITKDNIVKSLGTDKIVSNNNSNNSNKSFDSFSFTDLKQNKFSNNEILTISKLRSMDPKFRNEIGTISSIIKSSNNNNKSISKVNFPKRSTTLATPTLNSSSLTLEQQKREKLKNNLSASLLQSTTFPSKTNFLQLKQQQQQKQQDEKLLQQQPPHHAPTIKDDVARPSISLPNTKVNQKKSFYEDDNSNNNSGAPNSSLDANKTVDTNKDQRKSTDKKDSKSLNKSLNISSQNSGWFEGIWNKLSLKPKNQMILPDDKNPTIVWDPEKKRWVNTDGEEDTTESFKPPPKMSDIMPSMPQGISSNPTIPTNNNAFNLQEQQQIQQQPQQQHQLQNSSFDQTQHTQFNPAPNLSYQEQQQPQQLHQQQQQQQPQQQQQLQQPITENPTLVNNVVTAPIENNTNFNQQNLNTSTNAVNQQQQQQQQQPHGEPTKVPNLQSNMFKMQRNRTLKKSYVDVFNPSGAPSPKPAEPILAPAMPTIVPQTGFFIPAPVMSDGGEEQQQQEGAPQFYNPNQFGGYQQQ